VEAGLVEMVLNAVDGTKIAAQSSTTRHGLENSWRSDWQIGWMVGSAMAEVEKAEKEESGEYRLTGGTSGKAKSETENTGKPDEAEGRGAQFHAPGEPDAQ